jgi:hypothetical protein
VLQPNKYQDLVTSTNWLEGYKLRYWRVEIEKFNGIEVRISLSFVFSLFHIQCSMWKVRSLIEVYLYPVICTVDIKGLLAQWIERQPSETHFQR